MTTNKAIEMIDEYLLEPNSIAKEWIECLRLCKQALLESEKDGHIDEPSMTDSEIVVLVNKNARYSSQYKMIADLINRQKEQIKGLIAGQETLMSHISRKKKKIEELENEVERLTTPVFIMESREMTDEEIKRFQKKPALLTITPSDTTRRNEAIKEFTERLKEKSYEIYGAYEVVDVSDIDNLVEIMTPKRDTSVSLVDGHIESDKASRKAFWEDTN